MGLVLIISLSVVGLCILIMIIAYLTKGLRTKNIIEKMSDEESLTIKKVKEIFNDNSILKYSEILEKLGLPKDVINSHDAKLIRSYLPFKEDSLALNLL